MSLFVNQKRNLGGGRLLPSASREKLRRLSIFDKCQKCLTYCSDKIMDTPDSRTMGNKQYPNTLTTTPAATPFRLIRLRSAYIARQPTTPIP